MSNVFPRVPLLESSLPPGTAIASNQPAKSISRKAFQNPYYLFVMKGRMHLEEARKLVDNEILALKTRRNTYAPISQLSDDMLLEIFWKLKNARFKSWHQITHVCRYWRLVALSAASLWTRPPTHLHKYTLLMLERSCSSPLSIQLLTSTPEATSTAVLKYLGRIESLIVEQPKELLRHLQKILLQSQHEAAQLKTLRISQVGASRINNLKLSASPFRKMPILKHLSLAHIDFDWGLFPIDSLTSLELACPHLSTPPSWIQFQCALGEMPCLEHLALRLSDFLLTAPPGRLKPLELPLLRKLELDESGVSVMRSFLSNSSFPRLRNAYLDCSFNESSDPGDYSAAIGAALSLITKGNFDRLENLTIGDDMFTMSAKSSSGSSWAEGCSMDFLASYRGNSDIFRGACDLMAGLAALSGNLTSDIVHLTLSEYLNNLTSEHLVELFGRLPQLQSITVDTVGIDSQQIIKSFEISSPHPDTPIPFPKLTSIELVGQYHADEDIPELLQELGDCLKQRYRYGAGLKNLVVGWSLTEEEEQYVQELLADVKIR